MADNKDNKKENSLLPISSEHQGPPPSYPSYPQQAHYDAGPVPQSYYQQGPLSQPPKYQQPPPNGEYYTPYQGQSQGYQQPQLMYVQMPPPGKKSSGTGAAATAAGTGAMSGCCAAFCAALMCCCCLDCMF